MVLTREQNDQGLDILMPSLGVKVWGCRGSIPCSSPSTARFGGNTSCYQILYSGQDLLLVDAGTGIYPLGAQLIAQKPGSLGKIHILLSHVHWDHIQGLACCPFMHEPSAEVVFYSHHSNIQKLIPPLFQEPYFPVTWSKLKSRVEFRVIKPGEGITLGALRVETLIQKHPSQSLGYKFTQGKDVLAIMTDHELELMSPAERTQTQRFLKDVSLVFHDGAYTVEERAQHHVGWGHSGLEKVVEFCDQAMAHKRGQIVITHHAPYRTDEALTLLEKQCQQQFPRRTITLAQEGQSYYVPATADRP